MNTLPEHEVAFVPAKVGSQSLVGIGRSEYPFSFGNYFSLAHADPGSDKWSGWRINNFWAENLTEARKRFLDPNGLVRVQVWRWSAEWTDRQGVVHSFTTVNAIIDDPRIPPEWYYNKMCWTGGRLPPLEIAKQMYAVRGDETGELEMWTDPKSYYAKRGGELLDNGTVRYNIPARSLPFKDNGQGITIDAGETK